MTRKRRATILQHKGKQPYTPPDPWGFVFPNAEANQGRPFTTGGDINGDGFSDLVLGDMSFDHGRGQILVFLGAPTGLPSTPSWTREGTFTSQHFGEVVSILGDVDGNGCDELFVYGLGIVYGAKAKARVDERFSILSYSVPLGDVNGDGFGDVAAVLPSSLIPPGQGPTLGVFLGSAAGLKMIPDWIFASEQVTSYFAHDFGPAGDVNGDGFDDLIVGAMKFSGKFPDGGKAYLFLGSKRGLSATADWTSEYPLTPEPGVDEAKEQMFGRRLTGVGDVNGDGFDDVAIAAPFAENGDINEGLVFVYTGKGSGLSHDPDWVAESNQRQCVFGEAISEFCDVNGDGYSDVIIGAPNAADGQSEEGAVVGYYGTPRGLPRWPNWSMESDLSQEMLGNFIQSAGDLNGDGYGDVLIVASGHLVLAKSGLNETRRRCVVVYGGPNGFAPSHNWRLRKPLLAAAQQTFQTCQRRYGSVVYWGPPLLLCMLIACVSAAMMHRLRLRVVRLSEEKRGEIRDEERTRIMRNVHDALGADVSQMIADVREAQATIRPGDQPSPILEKLGQSANEAAETIDELVWLLNPLGDTLPSFVANAGEYAVRYLTSNRISCRLNFPETLPESALSAKTRHELHLVLKESLRNVVKHACAKRVVITLHAEGQHVELTIQDDGRGMPDGSQPLVDASTQQLPARGGVGFSSIRARIQELRGTVEIISTPGQGTTIRIVFPTSPH